MPEAANHAYNVKAASGIHLSEQYFVDHGGNLNDQSDTYWTVYQPLFDASFSTPLNSLLKVVSGGELCSCTYLGLANGYYWVVTSAHCLGSNGSSGVGTTNGPWSGSLLDFNQKTIGSTGSYYIPSERAENSTTLPSWGTDIALLQIKKSASPSSRNGNNLVPATLYSGSAEIGKQIKMGGHGSWGVGSTNQGGWSPPSNSGAFRRAYGDGFVQSLNSNAALQIPYTAADGTNNNTWAQVGPGDSGGSTFANVNNKFLLVGVNQSYAATHSIVTRISYYLNSFIAPLFPQVKSSS